MLKYNNDWLRFLKDIANHPQQTLLDQWALQMQTRVLSLIGIEKLLFVSDGIDDDIQRRISVTPILGPGDAQTRTQSVIDQYITERKNCRIAVIPQGPYVMLQKK